MPRKIWLWLAAGLAALVALAAGIGAAMKRRASSAAAALGKAREQDAEARGRQEADRARLQVIDGELARPTLPAPKRTAAQILAEQRRRGQLKE